MADTPERSTPPAFDTREELHALIDQLPDAMIEPLAGTLRLAVHRYQAAQAAQAQKPEDSQGAAPQRVTAAHPHR